jgi:hypothetical protein
MYCNFTDDVMVYPWFDIENVENFLIIFCFKLLTLFVAKKVLQNKHCLKMYLHLS